jgi:hypothetical protein
VFEGFTAYLAVERHCRPRTLATVYARLLPDDLAETVSAFDG